MKSIILFLTVISLPCLASVDAQSKGRSIAERMDKANTGFKGEKNDMTMVLIPAQGDPVKRKMRGETLEGESDGDKAVLEFLLPLDIKGTKLLTWSHKEKDDDQWLYLPARRRTRRISSSSRSSSFMGSEFSYEDLGGQEIDKYNYTFLRHDTINGEQVEVIERVSKKKSGYSKVISFISPKYDAPLKVEYYDRKGELLKVAEFGKYSSYTVGGKKFWRVDQIHMKNKQTRKESIIRWDNREVGVALKEKEFSKRALR